MAKTPEFFTLLRKRFEQAQQHESAFREKMLDDLRFFEGEGQWEDDIRRAREVDGRPCLTINRLPAHVHQVTNDIRQNRVAPRVSPVDDEGDIETADVYMGLIRHVDRRSNGSAVRSYAAIYAVIGGRGFYRINTEYSGPDPWDQEIVLKRIKNPASVYFDPSAQEPDYSDAQWCIVSDYMAREEYRRRWPKSKLADALGIGGGIGDAEPTWVSEDGVRVVEYFYFDYQEKELLLLDDGTSGYADELGEAPAQRIVRRRPEQVPTLNWCKSNGSEDLESTVWPGKWIPIIPILGEELDIDGRTELKGMVRNAKDPQRMYNYWATAETEAIALAPRAPFVGAEGQFEGHEEEWRLANKRSYPYLQYKPTTIAGQIAPPPQRQVLEPPVMAITRARAQAADDLKATTGIFDASLGARSNETSGVAIQRRQVEGDTANYHFIDAVNTAVLHETRILVDLAPKIYDRPGRVARIIGEDGAEKQVTLNAPFREPSGIERIYDLSAGHYDVAASVGPSYTTKRQEAADSMLEFIRVYPNAAPIIGHLIAKNMDWPGAQEIADLLKRALPPELQDEEEQPIPPQAKAKLAQLSQLVEQLTQALNQAQDKLDSKTLELESRERIEAGKQQLELIKTLATIDAQAATAMLQAEVAAIDKRLGLLREDEPVEEAA